MQILVVMSQFLLKGHKMFNFLVTFFLKISETLKAHISGTETDINKRFLVFNRLAHQANKKLSKISMHMHFKIRGTLLPIALIRASPRKQVHVYLTKNATSRIGFSITIVQFTRSACTLSVLTLQVWVS